MAQKKKPHYRMCDGKWVAMQANTGATTLIECWIYGEELRALSVAEKV